MRDETTHYEFRATWRYGTAEPIKHGPIRYGVADATEDIPEDAPHRWIEVRAVLPWSLM